MNMHGTSGVLTLPDNAYTYIINYNCRQLLQKFHN